ncbi:MAG: hypothetical protein AB7Q29_12745 [Vicinamibacterales bacterium]
MAIDGPARRGSVALASVTAAEAAAVALLLVPTTAILSAYACDLLGFRFLPWPIAVLSAGVPAALLIRMRRRAVPDRRTLQAFAAVVLLLFAWLLWIARPSLLPLGTGPDLTHHLMLIRYLGEHWRLVHDADAGRSLGEMAHYTPGSQLLAAFAGAWSGTDGLRALHPVLAATVALKAGFLLLILVRVLRAGVPRLPLAICGVLLLFAAPGYLLGGFTEFGFVAQVVAELFTIALWWGVVAWDERPSYAIAALFGAVAAATFLTWPVYIGPPVLALACTLALRTRLSLPVRVRHAVLALVPPSAAAIAHIAGRIGWLQLAGTGGTAPWPTASAYSWPLLVLALVGLLRTMASRTGRSTALFTWAIALQMLALWVLARRSGADRPYMALKLFYLLLWPIAACGAVGLGEAWRVLRRAVHLAPPRVARQPLAEWAPIVALVACVTGAVVPRLARTPHAASPSPAVSLPLYEAGRWARAHVPADCVEYLVGDDETAYWLHLAVLANPRVTERTADESTFELNPSLLRWLTPGGLRYAVADLDALPRDVRDELNVVARFETAAVARRSNGACPGE